MHICTYYVCTEGSVGISTTRVEMSWVEPLEKADVIKTLGLKEEDGKKHIAKSELISTHKIDPYPKKNKTIKGWGWKNECCKCLPYCLFPWAGTDVFAPGRPPSQSITHQITYSKTEIPKNGWLYITNLHKPLWTVPQTWQQINSDNVTFASSVHALRMLSSTSEFVVYLDSCEFVCFLTMKVNSYSKTEEWHAHDCSHSLQHKLLLY